MGKRMVSPPDDLLFQSSIVNYHSFNNSSESGTVLYSLCVLSYLIREREREKERNRDSEKLVDGEIEI